MQVLAFDSYCAAVQRDVHAIIGMCEAAAANAICGAAANVPVVGGLNSAAQPLGPSAPAPAPAAALERMSPAVPSTQYPAAVLQQQPASPPDQPRSIRKALGKVDSRTCLLVPVGSV